MMISGSGSGGGGGGGGRRSSGYIRCLVNLSIQDCGKNDLDLHQEMRKQTIDLLTEELQLQETVSKVHPEHMNATNLDAWRLASHYQREAEKCNAATEACEEARERAVALLRNEMRASLLWEQRVLVTTENLTLKND
ncbi:hypothetical protein AKJ16_DCAP05533, partial [Drosera capensis]